MTTDCARQSTNPRFIVCEDGREYLERFERFFGVDFAFVPAGDYATLLTRLEQNGRISGILLDLDFRRTAAAHLVDEHGQPLAQVGVESLAMHLANQGLFILASLRERGIKTHVLLFADIDEPRQCDYLKRTYAPLDLVPSHVSMRELKVRLAELGHAR